MYKQATLPIHYSLFYGCREDGKQRWREQQQIEEKKKLNRRKAQTYKKRSIIQRKQNC